MYRRAIYLIAIAGLMGVSGRAQVASPRVPVQNELYCGGLATTQAVPQDTYLISGQDSADKLMFVSGDKVFINKGSNKGVKVGDLLQVSRVKSDPAVIPWFVGQEALIQSMGTFYADIGQLRVVNVQDKTSTAEIVLACDSLQRGDIVQTFVDRPAPPLKSAAKLDEFAAPSGKAKATLVFTQDFGQTADPGRIVYVNLGSKTGVKVGDYLRIYHYQGDKNESVYNTTGNAYQIEGFGSTPKPYAGTDLPRGILGEGLVLRVSPSAATVLITTGRREIHVGDFVEVE